MNNRFRKWAGIALMAPMVAMVAVPLAALVATLALLVVGFVYAGLVEAFGFYWWAPLVVIGIGLSGVILFCRSVDALPPSPGHCS